MPTITEVFTTAEALGTTLAHRIADDLAAAAEIGRRYVLGCPGGRSLAPTYAALARLAAENRLATDPLVIAMMDEYVVPAPDDGPGEFTRLDPDESHSCRRFGLDHLIGPLDLPADRLLAPDPADPARYDRLLADLGGVDLFLLATGSSDGHVAFNPPGTPAATATRVVELAESTRTDNLRTFPHLRTLTDVPTHGVTVGVGTIARLSHAAVLVATGTEKHPAVRQIRAVHAYDPPWPATVVHACREPELYLDRGAALSPDSPELSDSPGPSERKTWPA